MYCLIKSLRSLSADSERAKEKILSSVRFSAVAVREIVCGMESFKGWRIIRELISPARSRECNLD